MNGQGEMPVGGTAYRMLRAKDRLLRARLIRARGECWLPRAQGERPLTSWRLFCARRECWLARAGAKDRLLRARLIVVRGANAGYLVLRAKDRLLRARLIRARGECRLLRAQGEGPLTSCAAHCRARGECRLPHAQGEGPLTSCAARLPVRSGECRLRMLGANDRLLRARLIARARGECRLPHVRAKDRLLRARLECRLPFAGRSAGTSCSGRRTAYFVRGSLLVRGEKWRLLEEWDRWFRATLNGVSSSRQRTGQIGSSGPDRRSNPDGKEGRLPSIPSLRDLMRHTRNYDACQSNDWRPFPGSLNSVKSYVCCPRIDTEFTGPPAPAASRLSSHHCHLEL